MSSLFCKKKGTVVNCFWPDSLYLKKSLYGGIAAFGLSLAEIALIALFFLAFLKMPHDFTRQFLFSVYFPLLFSSIFKLAGAVIASFSTGAFGFYFETSLMFFMYFYDIAILCVAIGSVFYLAMMMVVGCRRRQFHRIQPWTTYMSPLFLAALLSAAYNFAKLKWRGIPALSFWFAQIVFLVPFFVVLIWALIVLLKCSKKSSSRTTKNKDGSTTTLITTTTTVGEQDPAETEARSRLGWAILSMVVINLPNFIEIARISLEVFVLYKEVTTEYYQWQAAILLYFDSVRIFGSLIMLLAMLLSKNVRDALLSYLKKSPKTSKVFIKSQTVPLIQEHTEKTEVVAITKPSEPEKTSVITPIDTPISTITTMPIVSVPHHTTTIQKTTTVHQPGHQLVQIAPPHYSTPQYLTQPQVHQPLTIPSTQTQLYPGHVVPLGNQPAKFNLQPGYTTMLYTPPNQQGVYIEEIA